MTRLGQRLVTVQATAPLEQALMAMMIGGIRRLPVLDSTVLVGVISAADLALAGVAAPNLDGATPR